MKQPRRASWPNAVIECCGLIFPGCLTGALDLYLFSVWRLPLSRCYIHSSIDRLFALMILYSVHQLMAFSPALCLSHRGTDMISEARRGVAAAAWNPRIRSGCCRNTTATLAACLHMPGNGISGSWWKAESSSSDADVASRRVERAQPTRAKSSSSSKPSY